LRRHPGAGGLNRVQGGFVQLEGLQIHHVRGGRGSPPVLFIHGLGSAGYLEWRFNLPVIARSHRVFAPDLPGFGRSEKPPDGYGIPLFARVIDEYMRTRRIRPVLVGVSLGGRVALEVALRRPEAVRKLVLVNALGVARPNLQPFYPLVVLPRVGEGVLGLMKEALHRLPARRIRHYAGRYLGVMGDLERTLDEQYLAGLREMHSSHGYPRAYVATVRSLAHPRSLLAAEPLMARLGQTGLPVLIIWGARDRLLPLDRARAAQRLIPASRLEVIENAGHSPQSEAPDEFNSVLEDFVAS
jgi:pimeloyl-ACP methyl ester carboxylesterase